MKCKLISIKLVGGAKKFFSNDHFTFEFENIAIQDVIDYLIEKQSSVNHDFDGKNIMVAINGKDSSALDGMQTTVKSGDVLTIIPIIHGGINTRTQFKINKHMIEIFHIDKFHDYDNNYLQKIRKKFPKLTIQTVSSNYILSGSHVKKIVRLSLEAKHKKVLLSNKLETDILLRFAGTTQISEAIRNVGSKKNQKFILIAIGKKSYLDSLFQEINQTLTEIPLKNNETFLKKHFRVTNKQVQSINSSTPLEDLIVEKSSILI